MRIIDADALKVRLFDYYECVNSNTSKEAYKGETLMAYEVADMIDDCLENAPTLTPESLVKRGKWKADWFGEGLYDCSECGKVFDLSVNGEDFRFCPYCGCKMVEKAEAALTPASDVPEGE